MICEVVRYPHPALSTKCTDAVLGPSTSALAQDLAETLEVEGGVGLAAPQVRATVRVIVVKTKQGIFAMVNPRIVKRSGVKVWSVESCLSDPSKNRISVRVKRDSSITVEASDLEGNVTRKVVKEPLAFVVQHEIDHLNGVTIFDRVMGLVKAKGARA